MKQSACLGVLIALTLAAQLPAATPAERARGGSESPPASPREALDAATKLEWQWRNDPAQHGAPVEARLGDLYLEADDFRRAAAFYSAAAEHGEAVESRRGTLQGGNLYFHETFRSLKYSSQQGGSAKPTETNYLLRVDPATGQVRERYLLPGVPLSYRAEGERIEIEYQTESREWVYAKIRLQRGRLDHNFSALEYSGLEIRSIHCGWAPAVNFLYKKDETGQDRTSRFFTAREDPYPDAPSRIVDLERALRARIARDPTQPWSLFLLGQALAAQGRDEEAAASWEKLFSGSFPATPYWEFAWMARAFERYEQRSWADRAFREARERRRKLPQPVTFDPMNILHMPFFVPNTGESAAARTPDRAYLWWLRRREIVGVAEQDDFRARAWAHYFRRDQDRGQAERAAADLARLEQMRRSPAFDSSNLAWADYSAWLLLAALAGACFAFATWLRSLLRSHFPSLGRRLKWLRDRADVLTSLFMAVFAATALLGSVTDSDVLLLTNFTVGLLLLVRFGWCAWRRQPAFRRPTRPGARLLAGLRGIAWKTHGVLLLALGCLLFGTVLQETAILDVSGYNQGFQREGNEARLAEGIASHLAGDLERARKIYLSLPADPRARENLKALEQGRLPFRIGSNQELNRPHLGLLLLQAGKKALLRPWQTWSDWADYDFHAGSLAILLLLAVLAAWVPPRSAGPPLRWRPRLRRRAGKLIDLLIPGAAESRPVRRYLAFTLLALAAGPLLWLYGKDNHLPYPGSYSTLVRYSPAEDALLPVPAGMADPEEIERHFYWDFLASFPFAREFWTLVALSLAASLGLHGAALRAKASPPPSSEGLGRQARGAASSPGL